jgi:hypothetical protein
MVIQELKLLLQYCEISIEKKVNNILEHPLADHDRIRPLGGYSLVRVFTDVTIETRDFLHRLQE